MIKSQKFVKVVSNEPGLNSPDKNGRAYRTIKVQPLASTITDPSTGEVLPVIDMNSRPGTFNQWEDSYLIDGPDLAYNAQPGTLIPGAVVTRGVEPYSFIDKDGIEVTDKETYTTLVFGDTSDEVAWETAVKTAFRRADHQLLDDDYVAVEEQVIEKELPSEVEA